MLGKRGRGAESEGNGGSGEGSENVGESSPCSSKKIKLEEVSGDKQDEKQDSQTEVPGILKAWCLSNSILL